MRDLEVSAFKSQTNEEVLAKSKLALVKQTVGESCSDITRLMDSFLKFNPFFRQTAFESL